MRGSPGGSFPRRFIEGASVRATYAAYEAHAQRRSAALRPEQKQQTHPDEAIDNII